MSDLDLPHDELIDRAMTLLIAAAYGNPVVRRAVDQVEAEVRRLRADNERLTKYADHKNWCSRYRVDLKTCSCGFTAATS